MSFDIRWDVIAESENLREIRQSLNDKLKEVHELDFIDELRVEELELGPDPPEIFIEDLHDPKPPFTNNHAVNMEDIDDLQLTLKIDYSSPIKMLIRGEIVVNYPSPKFISLPIKFLIKYVRIKGRLSIARVDGKTMLSLHKEPDTDIDYSLESEIGDSSKHSTSSCNS